MSTTRIAQALGIIQGIIESDYSLCNDTSKASKVHLLRDNLSYLQDELVRNEQIAVNKAMPNYIEPAILFKVKIHKSSDAFPLLSFTELLNQAAVRDIDINLNYNDGAWTLSANDTVSFKQFSSRSLSEMKNELYNYLLSVPD